MFRKASRVILAQIAGATLALVVLPVVALGSEQGRDGSRTNLAQAPAVRSPAADPLALRPIAPAVAETLIFAIRDRDVATVIRLLAEGADPNGLPDGNQPSPHPEYGRLRPLFEAVLVDNTEIVEALLDAGAEMDAVFRLDRLTFHTALSFATLHRRTAAAMILLNRGADANQLVCMTSQHCGNAMTMAAIAGDVQLVRSLASQATQEEFHEFLSLSRLETDVAAGLKQEEYGTDSYDLLDLARYGLLNPLAAAARFGQAEVFSTLLEMGADIDGPDYIYEASPLRNARNNGHTVIVDLIQAEQRRAAEFIALVQSGDTASVRDSIARGANVNNGDERGLTPLTAAIGNEDVSMVRLLLSEGANPDKGLERHVVPYGDPKPLHLAIRIAIRYGDPALMRILLEAGADPNVIQRSNGEIDVHIPALAAAISNFNADLSTELVRELIVWGADTNATTAEGLHDDGWSYLSIAAQHGNVELVRTFIEAGIPLESPPSDDWTPQGVPLMEAAKHGRTNVIRLLRDEFDVDVAVTDRYGCTALDYAMRHRQDETAEFLRSLGVVAVMEACIP